MGKYRRVTVIPSGSKVTTAKNGTETITLDNGVSISKYDSKTGPPTIGVNPKGETGPKIRYEPK